MVVNRKVVLAKRPEGQLLESDFKVVEEELADLNGLDYEFTIIGSGPAGISLAIELSKNGKKFVHLHLCTFI